MEKKDGAARSLRPLHPLNSAASKLTAGHLGQTSSTNGACRFCGAPALRPNRKARRQGVHDYVMYHASWCRVHNGNGTIRPSGYTRRPA